MVKSRREEVKYYLQLANSSNRKRKRPYLLTDQRDWRFRSGSNATGVKYVGRAGMTAGEQVIMRAQTANSTDLCTLKGSTHTLDWACGQGAVVLAGPSCRRLSQELEQDAVMERPDIGSPSNDVGKQGAQSAERS